ncbi:MAG: 50S ribosomal protein L13 [Candidatus Babeliaceae bacterium]
MNKTFFLKTAQKDPRWRLIDAKDQVVGRLATQIADILRGKDTAHYTQHIDSGDYVVVINAEKVKFTGDKLEQKEYVWYTGWIGGQKRLTAQQMMDKKPEEILYHAVKGMLASTKMARSQLRKLLIYKGPNHPHKAQIIGHAPATKAEKAA